ncbi:MAG: hypothetical protein OXG11_01565 [Chloroflexi bacterium]|nr:hypothetical protein [Chloroflexota bacterium]
MKRKQWRVLIKELSRRGEGRRESGAFLMAPRSKKSLVTRIEYYDDLDPRCLTGNIHFHGLAFSKLWDICEIENLVVVADVHTHPGAFVHQSTIDAENPMVARVGHIALIVPHLATRSVSPRQLGVHQYLGDEGWTSWFGREAAARIGITTRFRL